MQMAPPLTSSASTSGPGSAAVAGPTSSAADHPSSDTDNGIENDRLPRIVVYQQTYFRRCPGEFSDTGKELEEYISMLPLIEEAYPCGGKVTHVILAAIHLNEAPGDITLNDTSPLDERHEFVWEEMAVLQGSGVRVLGMLGGAAKGTYARLDSQDGATFEAFYAPLRALVARVGFDGLDLDVEEYMSLAGIVRLVLRLRRDFGPRFLITLAPVAKALLGLEPDRNLSGFSYDALEKAIGREIAWYNVQFYNNWGSPESPLGYEAIVARGVFAPEKLVLGCITNPEAGAGWVPDDMLEATLRFLNEKYPALPPLQREETEAEGESRRREKRFGGVMGWEYFNSITVHEPYGRHWSWANLVSSILRP